MRVVDIFTIKPEPRFSPRFHMSDVVCWYLVTVWPVMSSLWVFGILLRLGSDKMQLPIDYYAGSANTTTPAEFDICSWSWRATHWQRLEMTNSWSRRGTVGISWQDGRRYQPSSSLSGGQCQPANPRTRRHSGRHRDRIETERNYLGRFHGVCIVV